MFNIDPKTAAITMHQGDTGAFWISAERDDGESWEDGDVLVWTVTNAAGEIMMQRVYSLTDENLVDGGVLIEFHNADTDTWAPATYNTERRYVVGPYYADADSIPDDGNIVRVPDGNPAATDPPEPSGHSTLTILGVLAKI